MDNADTIHSSREELYDQVWSEPMVVLAQKYGISDVGLRKRCKKLNIPLPPQGYFLREKRVKENRPPLPPFQGDGVIEIKKSNKNFPPPSVDQDQYREAEERIAYESLPENRIVVQARLTSPHPLIEKTKTILGNIESSGDNGIITAWRDECLDIRVSRQSLGRALRLMDALLKALESRGFKVSIAGRSYGRVDHITTVTVFGEAHEFSLKENLDQVTHEPPKESKKKETSWMPSPPKFDYFPSGRFTLSIAGYVGEGGRSSWSDGKKQKVENCLNAFIIGLIKASVLSRARKLEWERVEKERLELARRRIEEEQKREEEKKQIQALISEAQAWKHSQQIREYVTAVRSMAIEKHGEVTPGSELDKWIAWAKQLADRLDPLVINPPTTDDK